MKISSKAGYRAGLSLVEIIIAAGILAVVLLGVGSTYNVTTLSQRVMKERLAATLAAQSVLDEIDTYVRSNQTNFPGNLDDIVETDTGSWTGAPAPILYDRSGFHVFMGSSKAGSDLGAIGASGAADTNTLDPAADQALFPASRANMDPVTLSQAGYVRVLAASDSTLATPAGTITGLETLFRDPTGAPAARSDLLIVEITVAWRSYGGDQRIQMSMMVGRK